MIIKTKGLNELLEALDNVSENLPKDVYSALGAAGTKCRSILGKEIQKELNTKQAVIKKRISITKDRERLRVTVSLAKSGRIPLKEFGAKQNKQGVTAKISKRSGRKLYRPGFIVRKFGGHVYTRPNNGRQIAKLRGISPWGVVVKNEDIRRIVIESSRAEIRKQMERRIRFVELKKAGKLNWQEAENVTPIS